RNIDGRTRARTKTRTARGLLLGLPLLDLGFLGFVGGLVGVVRGRRVVGVRAGGGLRGAGLGIRRNVAGRRRVGCGRVRIDAGIRDLGALGRRVLRARDLHAIAVALSDRARQLLITAGEAEQHARADDDLTG